MKWFKFNKNAKDLSENEWYEIVKTRLEPDEIEDLEDDRKKQSETFVDLQN